MPAVDAKLDRRRAEKTVMELMPIPGKSGEEGSVQKYVVEHLVRAGVARSAIVTDQAHRRSPLGGTVGNLILKVPGTIAGPRRLLAAHLDTVPLCVGSRPVKKGSRVRSADRATGLGGDNRAGCAVLLTAVTEILSRKLPHPPLTLVWFVQEEVGLQGSHFVDIKKLGRPRLSFNWDGRGGDKIILGATGGYRMTIDVRGIASHAGGAPEKGVSAIAAASLAVADLHRGGWHGKIEKNGAGGRIHSGTSNVGVVAGGLATNVVADHVHVRAEARSHDPRFRKTIVRQIEQAFRRAAREVTNTAGKTAKVKIEGRLDYESFRLAFDEPCVAAAEATLRSLGIEPDRSIANGGLDANWLTARGIPSVTLGCGQVNIHTTAEELDLDAYYDACRVALRLATATENE
jgi:tripeptide aminopeptidase